MNNLGEKFTIDKKNQNALTKELLHYVFNTQGCNNCPDFVILEDRSCHKIRIFESEINGLCLITYSDDYWYIYISHNTKVCVIKSKFRKRIVDYYGNFTFIWLPSRLQVYELFVELDLFDEINLIDIILSFLSFKQ